MENFSHQRSLSLIMNKGLEKAVKAFSQLVNHRMTLAHSNIILVHHDQEFTYVSGETGNLMVLTTDMIGELSGRSYLILSERERDEVCSSVTANGLDAKLQEALMLEIDNIVSASVISQLADDLGIEVYGDVPHLQYVRTDHIQQFLSTSIPHERDASIILCNTTFMLDNHDHIHPQFIWKLSTKVFEMVQQQVLKS